MGESTGSWPRTIWLRWGGGRAHPQAGGWGAASPHPHIFASGRVPRHSVLDTGTHNERSPGRSLQHSLISRVGLLTPPRSPYACPHPSLRLSIKGMWGRCRKGHVPAQHPTAWQHVHLRRTSVTCPSDPSSPSARQSPDTPGAGSPDPLSPRVSSPPCMTQPQYVAP